MDRLINQLNLEDYDADLDGQIDVGAGGANINDVDRGNPNSYDFQKSDLKTQGYYGSWQDLDLSSIVGAKKQLVLLRIEVSAQQVHKSISFRTKGNTYNHNIAERFTQLELVTMSDDLWVYTDSNGMIQYKLESATWGVINILVRIWFDRNEE